MRRIPAVPTLAALALALALGPRPAAACSCTNTLSLQEEFDISSVVFSGRVTSITTDPFGTLVVTFAPLQRWRGPLDAAPWVVTGLDSAACGFPFVVGEEYLVFARGGFYGVASDADFAGLCSRTSPLAGNPYVAQLPPPLLPTPASAGSWGALKLVHR